MRPLSTRTVAIAIVVGIPLGGLAAARRGWVEDVVMRLSDVIYAFPPVLLAILLVAYFYAWGKGVFRWD